MLLYKQLPLFFCVVYRNYCLSFFPFSAFLFFVPVAICTWGSAYYRPGLLVQPFLSLSEIKFNSTQRKSEYLRVALSYRTLIRSTLHYSLVPRPLFSFSLLGVCQLKAGRGRGSENEAIVSCVKGLQPLHGGINMIYNINTTRLIYPTM